MLFCRKLLGTIQRRPHVKNALIASGVGAAGDLACQAVQGQDQMQIDRTARFAGQRLFIWGPLYSVWMTSLERIVGNAITPRLLLAKIALDQLVWAPPMIGVFFISMSTLEGQSLATTWHRTFGASFWDGLMWQTCCLNWQFWPAVQGLTYGVVPLPYRIAFLSTVNMFWNGVLSKIHDEGSVESLESGVKECVKTVKDKSKEEAGDAEVAGGVKTAADSLLCATGTTFAVLASAFGPANVSCESSVTASPSRVSSTTSIDVPPKNQEVA